MQDAVEDLRAVKDACELAVMRGAADLIRGFSEELVRVSGPESASSIWRRRSNTGLSNAVAAAPPSIRLWPRDRVPHGRMRAELQTAGEKRIGRPRPGCYTSRLLQRHDAHRLLGPRVPKASGASTMRSWRPSSGQDGHPARRHGRNRGQGSPGHIEAAWPCPVLHSQHGTWAGLGSP